MPAVWEPDAIPLYARIFLGLIAGLLLGAACRSVGPDSAVWAADHIAYPLGQIFLRLIFMTVVPLIFVALVSGVSGLGELRRLGRVGLKTLAMTLALSLTAALIGVGLCNFVRPGKGLDPTDQARLMAEYEAKRDLKEVQQSRQAKSAIDALLDVIPRNPLEEAVFAFSPEARGGLLAVMFFALTLGLALAAIPQETSRPVLHMFEGFFHALMKIISWAMCLAPFGVAGLVFSTTAKLGLTFLPPLASYVGVVLAGLAIHFFLIYGALIAYVLRMNPLEFFRRIRNVMLTAFATASSNATLPTSLQETQSRLGVPREIAGFVLTLGSTANQNGTALFEGVTALFLAQFFGAELPLGQQVIVVLLSVLAGVGTAGVPGGSLPMIVILLETVGVPGAGIAIVLGVDRILDMCRTTLNVTGDILVAAWVARSEGYALAPESSAS